MKKIKNCRYHVVKNKPVDCRYVKKVGIQAAITRYSNKFGYDRNKVIAGINSSLTRMGL